MPSPTPSPTPAPTPTPLPKHACIPAPEQPLTAEQEQAIAGVPWAEDRARAPETLRRLAGVSDAAFKALIQWGGDSASVLTSYTSIAVCDETAAIRILEMPFMEHLNSRDYSVLGTLRYMAETDIHGFREILDYPAFQGGIADEHAVRIQLLFLKRHNPSAATALEALPWMEGVITPSADGDTVHQERYFHPFDYLRHIGRNSPETFSELIEKSWVRDGRALLNNPRINSGCGWGERGILNYIYGMSIIYGEETANILRMPFLNNIGRGEWSTLDILYDSMGANYAERFKWLIAQPEIRDGITDDERTTVALLDLEFQVPSAAETLRSLPWVNDGVAPDEEEGVLVLRELALASTPVFDALARKPWMQDGISFYEARVIEEFTSGSLVPVDNVNFHGTTASEATALQITGMPFLSTIEGLDLVALCALSELVKRTDDAYLQQVFSHPTLQDGITDELTSTVANLDALWDINPDLVDVVLTSEPDLVERRTVTLPLAGRVDLAVVRTRPGTPLTMDLLEHALRSQEAFMGVAFPTDYATVLVTDTPWGARGGSDASMIIRPGSEGDLWVIAQLLAFTYWHDDSNRVVLEASGFLRSISLGADAAAHRDGLFPDLYRGLGDEAFREGFGKLYVAMRDDVAAWGEESLDECSGAGANLCYLRRAFVAGVPPEEADVAEAIIIGRYPGSS